MTDFAGTSLAEYQARKNLEAAANTSGETLGAATNVPTVSSFAQETGAAPLINAISNFSIPSMSQKVAELGGKLASSGIGGLFSKGTVGSSPNNAVQTALNGVLGKKNTAGVPANMMPARASLGDTSQLKVIISQEPEIGELNKVVFDVMPRIDESASVDYEPITPIHHPGVIQKYRNSSVRSWRISSRLISRTSAEATLNLQIINTIRSWQKPFFGEGTAASKPELLGAPPPILTLSAYGPRMIGPVKCVMKDCNWTWDNSLDWIPTNDGNPFPVIIDVNISLEESWSPAEYSGFDIVKYKQGDLSPSGAFQRVTAPPVPPAATTAPAVSTVATGAGAGRSSGRGGPTAEELRQYDQAQFQAKAAAANMTYAETGGGAALMYRKPTRRTTGGS